MTILDRIDERCGAQQEDKFYLKKSKGIFPIVICSYVQHIHMFWINGSRPDRGMKQYLHCGEVLVAIWITSIGLGFIHIVGNPVA